MPEQLDIASGSEQWLPFAKNLLFKLHKMLDMLGLDNGRRHYVTPDGSGTIILRTSRNRNFFAGSIVAGIDDETKPEEWWDYIKIEAPDARYYVFSPQLSDPGNPALVVASVVDFRTLLPLDGYKFRTKRDLEYARPWVTPYTDRSDADGFHLATPAKFRGSLGYFKQGVFKAFTHTDASVTNLEPELIWQHEYPEDQTTRRRMLAYDISFSPVLGDTVIDVGENERLVTTPANTESVESTYTVEASRDGRTVVVGGYSLTPVFQQFDITYENHNLGPVATRSTLATGTAGTVSVSESQSLSTASGVSLVSCGGTKEFGNGSYSTSTVNSTTGYGESFRNISWGVNAAGTPVAISQYSAHSINITSNLQTSGSLRSDQALIDDPCLNTATGTADSTYSLRWTTAHVGSPTVGGVVGTPTHTRIQLPGGISKTFQISGYNRNYSEALDADYSVTISAPNPPGTQTVVQTATRTMTDNREELVSADLRGVYIDPAIPMLIYEYETVFDYDYLSVNANEVAGTATRTVGRIRRVVGGILVGSTEQVWFTEDTDEVGPTVTAPVVGAANTIPSIVSNPAGPVPESSSSSNSGSTLVAPTAIGGATYGFRPARTLSSTGCRFNYQVVALDQDNWVVGMTRLRPVVGTPNHSFDIKTARLDNARVKTEFIAALAKELENETNPTLVAMRADLLAGVLNKYDIRLMQPDANPNYQIASAI